MCINLHAADLSSTITGNSYLHSYLPSTAAHPLIFLHKKKKKEKVSEVIPSPPQQAQIVSLYQFLLKTELPPFSWLYHAGPPVAPAQLTMTQGRAPSC